MGDDPGLLQGEKINDRFGNLSLSMFTQVAQPWAKFPRLNGKAGEIKNFGGALQHVFESNMVPHTSHHRQILLLLKMGNRLEKILEEQRTAFKFEPVVADEFEHCAWTYAQLTTALANYYIGKGIFYFDTTVKMHYVIHAAVRARHLSPRCGWCYAGEDFQNKVKRLAQSCVRGTAPWMFARKFVLKYIFGITLRILDRDAWFRLR